jgi:hypothetical protein
MTSSRTKSIFSSTECDARPKQFVEAVTARQLHQPARRVWAANALSKFSMDKFGRSTIASPNSRVVNDPN